MLLAELAEVLGRWMLKSWKKWFAVGWQPELLLKERPLLRSVAAGRGVYEIAYLNLENMRFKVL